MGLVDRLPPSALRWAGRQQFRPVIGPVVKAASSRLLHRPRVVGHGQAAGLRIDPGGAAAGYALGTSEPLIQDVFAEHVPSGGVVWDIGANVGFFTLIASRLVGAGTVVAFEPLPANQDAIRRNIALNDISNVQLVGIALSDCEGTAELEIRASPTWAKLDTSADTAFKRDTDVAGRVEVALSTIDAQLAQLAAPDLVKMDIEGAEHAFLPEVKPDTLAGVDAWQMEYHPNGPKQALFQALERASLRLRHDQLDGENGGVAHFARVRS